MKSDSSYEVDLKALVGGIQAELKCLTNIAILTTRSETSIYCMIIDPSSTLTVESRISNVLQVSSTNLLVIEYGLSKDRVLVTVTRDNPKAYEYWSIDIKGNNRVFFKGSNDSSSS